MTDCFVSLSEQAFFTIVTSALEAYRVDHSELSDGAAIRLETFGHLWGYENQASDGVAVYRVVLADVSTAAFMANDCVRPKELAKQLKAQFVDTFFPELMFIGDFHSHPYSLEEDEVKTELDLERKQLYQFSSADFSRAREMQDDKQNYRIGLVATVYERERKISRSSTYVDVQSCIRFQYENLTVWIKAYVWFGDDYRRKSDKMVGLICPNLGFGLC
jgi:hypothetical protein